MITTIIKDIILTTTTKDIYLGSETSTNQNDMKGKISGWEWKIPHGAYDVYITIGGKGTGLAKEIMATFTPGNEKIARTFRITREELEDSLTLIFTIRNKSSEDGTLKIFASSVNSGNFKLHVTAKKQDVLY